MVLGKPHIICVCFYEKSYLFLIYKYLNNFHLLKKIFYRMAHITEINDNESMDDLNETVKELRTKLNSMRKLMEEKGIDSSDKGKGKPSRAFMGTLLIDANFLSVVFGVVLVLIICVTFHAFQSLYFAILKKFNLRHTEL